MGPLILITYLQGLSENLPFFFYERKPRSPIIKQVKAMNWDWYCVTQLSNLCKRDRYNVVYYD